MDQEKRIICYDSDLKIEAYRFQGIMQKFPNHFHEHYVIGFIESGLRFLSCKNQSYTIGTGDLLLLNPLDNHTCEQVDGKTLDCRFLNIKPETMRGVVQEITGENYLPQFVSPVIFHSDHVLLLKEVHQMIMEEQKEFQKEESFLFLMERLIELYTSPVLQSGLKKVNSEINLVCEYLDKNYDKHTTLDALSKIAGMNKYSLLRAFTRMKGITPYRYLETVRVNEAKKLLEKGVGSLDASIMAGFSDQSHFTNFFKEFIGLTPKQYQSIFLELDK